MAVPGGGGVAAGQGARWSRRPARRGWVPRRGVDGGVTSARCNLNADIHLLDNSASRAGHLLESVAGDEAAVARAARRDHRGARADGEAVLRRACGDDLRVAAGALPRAVRDRARPPLRRRRVGPPELARRAGLTALRARLSRRESGRSGRRRPRRAAVALTIRVGGRPRRRCCIPPTRSSSSRSATVPASPSRSCPCSTARCAAGTWPTGSGRPRTTGSASTRCSSSPAPRRSPASSAPTSRSPSCWPASRRRRSRALLRRAGRARRLAAPARHLSRCGLVRGDGPVGALLRRAVRGQRRRPHAPEPALAPGRAGRHDHRARRHRRHDPPGLRDRRARDARDATATTRSSRSTPRRPRRSCCASARCRAERARAGATARAASPAAATPACASSPAAAAPAARVVARRRALGSPAAAPPAARLTAPQRSARSAATRSARPSRRPRSRTGAAAVEPFAGSACRGRARRSWRARTGRRPARRTTACRSTSRSRSPGPRSPRCSPARSSRRGCPSSSTRRTPSTPARRGRPAGRDRNRRGAAGRAAPTPRARRRGLRCLARADLRARHARRGRGRARDPRRRARDGVRAAPPRRPRRHEHAREPGDADFLAAQPWLRLTAELATGDVLHVRAETTVDVPHDGAPRWAASGTVARGGRDDRRDRGRSTPRHRRTQRPARSPRTPSRPCSTLLAPAGARAARAARAHARRRRGRRRPPRWRRSRGSAAIATRCIGRVLAARMAGLPRPIVHGAWTAARLGVRRRRAVRRRRVPAARLARDASWRRCALGAPLDFEATRVARRRRPARRAGAGARGGDGRRARRGGRRSAADRAAVPRAGDPARGARRRRPGRSRAARAVWERADAHTRAALGFSLLEVVERNPRELRLADGRVAPAPGRRPVPHRVHAGGAGRARRRAARGAAGRGRGRRASVAAGHSVGEFAALHALGALDARGGAELVYRRGEAMQAPRPARRGRLVAVPARGRRRRSTGSPRRRRDRQPQRAGRQYAVVGHGRRDRRARAGRQARVRCRASTCRFTRRRCAARWTSSGRTSRRRASIPTPAPAAGCRTCSPGRSRPGDDVVELLARQLASPVRWIETPAARSSALGVRRFIEVAPAHADGADRPGADDGRRTSSCCTRSAIATSCSIAASERRCPPRWRCPPGRTRPLARPLPMHTVVRPAGRRRRRARVRARAAGAGAARPARPVGDARRALPGRVLAAQPGADRPRARVRALRRGGRAAPDDRRARARRCASRARRIASPGAYLRDALAAGLTRAGVSRADARPACAAGASARADRARARARRAGHAAGPVGARRRARAAARRRGRARPRRRAHRDRPAARRSRASRGRGGRRRPVAVRRARSSRTRCSAPPARSPTALGPPVRAAGEPRRRRDPDAARLAILDAELGAARATEIAPRFDARRHVRFASAWASARWDLVTAYHDALAGRLPTALARRSTASPPTPASRRSRRPPPGSPRRADGDAGDRARRAHGRRPRRAGARCRCDRRRARRSAESSVAGAAAATGVRPSTTGRRADRDVRLRAPPGPRSSRSSRSRAADRRPTCAHETARSSPARRPARSRAALVRRLLRGGREGRGRDLDATRPSGGASIASCTGRGAGPGAELHVVPANLASFADIDALAAWLRQPGRRPARSRRPADRPAHADARSRRSPRCPPPATPTRPARGFETAIRLQLLGVQRLIGASPARRSPSCCRSRPTTARSAATVRTARRRRRSRCCSPRAHASRGARTRRCIAPRIGWVRGTGLMGANDAIAPLVEERLGVRTFAADEMGWLLTRLLVTGQRRARSTRPAACRRSPTCAARSQPLADELRDALRPQRAPPPARAADRAAHADARRGAARARAPTRRRATSRAAARSTASRPRTSW